MQAGEDSSSSKSEDKALSPSVRYLVSVLEDRIDSGHYAHGRWLPSERSLAQEFAVCRPTVRQAIVELELRNLIQRTAGHRPIVWNGRGERRAERRPALPEPPLLYPHKSFAALTGSSVLRENRAVRSLGLWIAGSPRDMGPLALTNGIHQGLGQQESLSRLVTFCPQGSGHQEAIRSEEVALLRLAEDRDVAGVILWYLGGQANLPALERLRESGKALVFVDREPPLGFEADFVGVHNTFAAAEAVRYLIGLGHRRIAHVTNADRASTVIERQQGYQQALREAGIALRSDYVVQGPFKSEQDEEQEWIEIAERLFSLPEPPTAAFAVNDYTAQRLIRMARLCGKRVPEDLAVVGFDNLERWSAVDPFMTSVSQPFEQIGSEAARLLHMRLDWPQVQTYRHVLLPATLVVRRSAGGTVGR